MNYLLIAVLIILALFAINGYRKGLLKILFTTLALIVTIIIAALFTDSMADFIKDNTPVYDTIYETFLEYSEEHIGDAVDEAGTTAQEAVINSLPLPDNIKDKLIDNNDTDTYSSMGVVSFSDYVAATLTDIIIMAIAFIILIILISIVLRVAFAILNAVAKLPLIKTANKVVGLLIGIVQGMIFIWICCIFITIFSASSWGQSAFEMINDSMVLSIIYNNNYLLSVITNVFQIF